MLALKYLAEHAPAAGDRWNGDGRHARARPSGVTRTEAFARSCRRSPASTRRQATRLLWDTYQPQYAVWLPFAAIGVAAVIALAIFGRMARRWSDMNA